MSKIRTRHPGGCASRKPRLPEKRNCRKLSQKGLIPGGNEIYLLIDSALYFLEHVFIHCQDKEFRLVVIHDNQVYHNLEYKTLREAQAAFLEHFRQRAWKEGIKPDWSCKYKVDRSWLRDKYRLIAGSGDKPKRSSGGTKKSPFFGRSIRGWQPQPIMALRAILRLTELFAADMKKNVLEVCGSLSADRAANDSKQNKSPLAPESL